MICNTIGLTADSYQSIYVTGGAEVAEVYGGINDADPVFYKTQTVTGSAPLYVYSYPNAVKNYTIFGNMVQTPTPMSCGDKTANVFDKNASTTAGITVKKYTLTGLTPGALYTCSTNFVGETNKSASIYFAGGSSANNGVYANRPKTFAADANGEIGVEVRFITTSDSNPAIYDDLIAGTIWIMVNEGSTVMPYEPYGYKIPLTCGGVTQTIYLLEPLRKATDGSDTVDAIDYATQTLTREVDANGDALATPTTEAVTVPELPTVSGLNTLTVGTTLRPSRVCVMGHVKPSNSYGNLRDVNDVLIKDKDGIQIKIIG